MSTQSTHPTPDELKAFSLGQMPPESAKAVEGHVAECGSCCETLLGLVSDDTFVALLQEADEMPSDETLDHISKSPASRRGAGPLPPALLDHPRYAIVAPLGSGGMGDVYKAEHRMMERTVALKVIKRQLLTNPTAVERFQREVKSAARLSHQNIVTAYDAEQADDVNFLVMEYVEGVDLAHKVREEGPLPVDQACEFVYQTAMGLQHAHEKAMVHRDIKPHNLMVTGDGVVKILDFGLAALANDTIRGDVVKEPAKRSAEGRVRPPLTTLGTMMGTPDFISPEQAFEPHAVDIRSDIYSLGCTFYYLLTGRPPFSAETVIETVEAHADQRAIPIESLRKDLPQDVVKVVEQMMAKDPAERFATPAAVADALATWVESKPSAVRSKANVEPDTQASASQNSWWPPTLTQVFGDWRVRCSVGDHRHDCYRPRHTEDQGA